MTAARFSSDDLPQLQRLFLRAPAAVAWLDGPQHVFRFCNDAYLRLVGRDDLVGRAVVQALPELAAQGILALLDGVYASGEAYVGNEVEIQLDASVGSPHRVVDFVFQPVRDEGGAVCGIFVQATDATQRVAAQAALRESESKFRAITNSIDQMIWSTLPDGFHDYYNDRWYEYTGVPHGSTDGVGWSDMFHPDDQQRAWTVWSHSLASGEPYHIEYRLRHRSGRYRWVLGRAQAMRDEQGRIVRWFGTCTDIQDIVDAREVLRRSGAELERQVQLRTDQLLHAEAQLRQAHKMEAIGQLTGGIAHDFNNMLQGIVGALEVIRRLDAQGRPGIPRFVDMAMSSAQRAAAMTHRLLAFSRRQPLAPQQVDLIALVHSLRELVRRTTGEAIELELELAPDTWPTECDPNQLESAILNLTINARDAMPHGGTLTVCTRNVTLGPVQLGLNDSLPGGDFVRVTVGDTGTGMPQDVIARAFDPFFTTKPIGQGTGLGLSMVYGFARQSGGYATIASESGAGTRVSLLLPRSAGLAAEPPMVLPVEELAPGQGQIIVVVEDDEVVRTLTVETLRNLGYVVHDAATGPEGARLLNLLGPVDLLLSDIGLPGGISGKQLADAARAMRPDLKVILITGYAQEVLETDLVSQRMTLLRKPILIDVLLRKVQEVIRGG